MAVKSSLSLASSSGVGGEECGLWEVRREERERESAAAPEAEERQVESFCDWKGSKRVQWVVVEKTRRRRR